MEIAVAGAAAKPKRSPTLMPDRMGLAEHKRKDWVVDAEVGVTIEDIQQPSYWAMVARDFDPLDTIEVRADDGKWIAHLRVMVCERTYAKVRLLNVEKYEENMERPQDSYKFKTDWKGAHMKFCVIRVEDSQILQQGFKTREEADVWMRAHERSQ